jgi:putative acetyltransferase
MKNEYRVSIIEVTIFKEKELDELINLFYETIHAINAKDYNLQQLSVWAPKNINSQKWKKRSSKNYLFIARDENKIIGFGELSPNACIDMLYVHKDYLRQGIGKKLLDVMIKKAQDLNFDEIFAEASKTAKPFFETQGFKVIKKQIKKFNSVDFMNYRMKKVII